MVEFDTEATSRGCSNSYIVTHKQTPEMITEKWNLLKRHGKICKEEVQKKAGYIYDWDMPPRKDFQFQFYLWQILLIQASL